MGAALGAGLGALLGVAGGYERAQAEKRQNANAAFLDLAMKNPSVFASDPALLKEVGKRTSPEFADLLGGIGKHAAQFQSQIQGAVSGGGGASSPAAGGQMMAGPGAPAGGQPAAAQDPMTAHIQQLDTQINKLETIMTSPGAADPSNAPAVEHLKTLLTDLREQRKQLSAEAFQHQEHEDTRADREEARSESRKDREQARGEARSERESARADRAADRATARQDRLDARKQARDDREEARKQREADKTTSEADRKELQKQREDDKREAQADRQFATNDKIKDAWRDRMEKRLEKIQDFPTSAEGSKLDPDELNRQLNTKIAAYTALLKSDETGFKKRGIDVDTSDLMPSLTPATAASGGVPLVHWGGKPATTATVDTGSTPDAAASGTTRTDTSGKKWKLSADGSKWEPADAGPAAAPTGR